MHRAEAFRDGGREVQQRAALLFITAKTNSPDRRQSPGGCPCALSCGQRPSLARAFLANQATVRFHAATEVAMAKKAKKSTKKPAGKSSAKRRKASKGVLAGAMATVRKQARKLGI